MQQQAQALQASESQIAIRVLLKSKCCWGGREAVTSGGVMEMWCRIFSSIYLTGIANTCVCMAEFYWLPQLSYSGLKYKSPPLTSHLKEVFYCPMKKALMLSLPPAQVSS